MLEIDYRSLRRAVGVLAEGVGAEGVGRVQNYFSDDVQAWSNELQWGWHHMGTTRMHEDPKQGVVDAQCRVHGVGNLFIAGSSVFPTVGKDYPTLTLVALAIRAADHIKGKFF